MTFADQITAIDSCVAYHNGPNYTVEVDLSWMARPRCGSRTTCASASFSLCLPAPSPSLVHMPVMGLARPDSIAPPSSRPHTHSSQALQDKLEELPQVDRAFVHVDHETSHKPEHRKTK